MTPLTPGSAARCVAFIVGALLCEAALMAQTQTGTIHGHVYNPVAQSYVRDAEVRLDKTSQVTYTENDGSFTFTGVPAGPATITVTYTGYNTVTQSLEIAAGQTVEREITLIGTEAGPPKAKDGPIQLEAVTVSSEREGNSKAIMAQRRNMNITTSVSSDIFGDVTDGNVGEFLKYLPGVDLDYVESEPRGPRLGGMDGQYVGVSFDGMRTASADANRGGGAASRATSFEGFSITSIDSIEINYTASPEDDADSPAGIVNMKTKRAFDRKGRRIDYNVGVNFNGEEFTGRRVLGPAEYKEYPWKPNYQFSYSESFFHNRFGLLVSASQANSFTEQQTMTVTYNRNPTASDPRSLVARQIDFKDGPKVIRKDALLLTADFRATPRLTLSLNMIYSYFDGEFWNRNFTFVAANDNANVNNGRSTVGGDGMTTVIATRAPSGSVNNVATLNNGGGGAAKLTYTRQFAPKFEYRLGSLIVDGALAVSFSKNNYEALERGFSKDEGGGVPSSWVATRASPMSAEWTIRQTSGASWLDLHNFNSTDSRSGGMRVTTDDREWITEKWTGMLNGRYPLPILTRFLPVLKMGGKWDEETRTNNNHTDWDIWSYTGPGGNTTTVDPNTFANRNVTFGNWANLGPDYYAKNPFELGRMGNIINWTDINGVSGVPPRVDRNAMDRLFREHPEQWTHMGTPENWYDAFVNEYRHFRQTVSGGYAQLDGRITRQLQTRFGIRMEETETQAREFNPLSRADVVAAGYAVNSPGTNSGRPRTIEGMRYQFMSQPMQTRKANYQNWFPSVVLKYRLRENFDWQFGWNKAIGRPAIDDLTGVWAIDENNQRVTVSNTKLQPEFHEKFQSRLAYYFSGRSPGSMILSFAQVRSRNFTQQFDFSASEFGVDNPDFANYTFRTRVNSPGEVTFRSMDIAYNQTLGFLPSPYLRGLNVMLNYTRGYADQRRAGLAPHRVAARLGYSYKRFSSTVGLIWVDDKPESSTYGRYMGQMTKIDLSLTYRLTRNVSLYVQGRNITDMPDRWYQSATDVAEGTNPALRSIEKYGSNWVFGVKGFF